MGLWTGKITVRDSEKPDMMRIAETKIDIVAVSRNLKDYLINNCKFKRVHSVMENIRVQLVNLPRRKKANFYYALFSESGFEKKIQKEPAENDRLTPY